MQALKLEVHKSLLTDIFENTSRVCLYLYPVPKCSLLLIGGEQYMAKLTFGYGQVHSCDAEKFGPRL